MKPRGREPILRYVQPGWLNRVVFNATVRALTGVGISVAGSREL